MRRVHTGNKYWEYVKCRIQQGSILYPDLFNIFLTDKYMILELIEHLESDLSTFNVINKN